MVSFNGFTDSELQSIARGERTRSEIEDDRRVRSLGGMEGEFGSFLSGAGDSLSLGFGDELHGLAAGIDASMQGRDFGTAYGRQTEKSRQRLRDAWKYHAGSTLAGSVAGALPMGWGLGAIRGGALAARLATLSPLQRIGSAAAGGAAVGSLYGAGSSEGRLDTSQGLQQRGIGALQGGALGGVTGGALQGVGMAGSHAWRSLVRPALEPEQRAAMELGKGLERAGITSPEQFASKARQLQRMERISPGSNPMVMDALEGAGTDMTMVAGARQSAGRQAMRSALEARNAGSRDRATNVLWRDLGGGSKRNAAKSVEELEELQKLDAAPKFARVYQQTVHQVPPQLKEFVRFNDRSGARFKSALETTRETMRREMGDTVTDEQMQRSPLFWHRLLENVSGEVGASIRSARINPLGGPRGSAIADMTKDSRLLNDQVRNLLGPEFRQAMDVYAGAAKSMDAIEVGYNAVRQTGELKVGTTMRQIARMSRGEREQARFAAISALSDELARADTMTGRADVLRAVIGNEAKRETLRALFGGEAKFNRVIRALEYERRLFLNSADTNIGRGSPTADKTQGAAQVFGMDGGGIVQRARQALGREAQQRYDEQLANSILDLMRTPLTGPSATTNPLEIAQRQGLLSRALREAERRRTFRSKVGPQAFSSGAFNAVGMSPNEMFQ